MKENEKNEFAGEMLAFIDRSPSAFHAVENFRRILLGKGFSEIFENRPWNLMKGGKYFVTRNGSSIISFVIPENGFRNFRMTASHSDSPAFKIKPGCSMKSEGVTRLNVEKYGGMLCAPWFDRPLGAAGRLVVSDGTGVRSVLVDIDRDLLMIPSLAVHMNRDSGNKFEANVQNDMLPVLGLGDADIMELAAEKAGVRKEDVLDSDLFLYNRDRGIFWGAGNEFIASPRLDDLECAYSTLTGFLDASGSVNGESAAVHCVFDNEEVGSATRQGAASTFLRDTLYRISAAFSEGDFCQVQEEFFCRIADSFMISADNAHAVHPNYAGKADPVNRPEINRGPVIKYNAAQRYCTDAVGASLFKQWCNAAEVPFQVFTNRSDMPGGSTLGNISNSQVSVPGVDIGLPQWAMHSPFESAGALDPEMLSKVISVFYRG